MSKFCQKCGRPMADDMRFCEACGAPAPVAAPQQPAYQQPAPQQPVYQQPVYQQPAPQQPVYQQPAPQQPVYRQPAPQQPVYQQPAPQQAPQAGYRTAPVAAPAKPKQGGFDMNKIIDKVKTFANGVVNRCKTDKKFLLICCAIALAVVALLILLLVVAQPFKSSQVKAVEKYIGVMYSGKGSSSRIKSLAPKEYWEYVEDNDGHDCDFKDAIDEYEDWWEDQADKMEDSCGKNIKVKFEHKNTVNLSKSDVNDIAEVLDKKYGIDEDDVTAGKRIQGVLYVVGNDEEDGWNAMIVDRTVVKINGKWYPLSGSNFAIDDLVGTLAYNAR